jgi:hypothetical protein
MIRPWTLIVAALLVPRATGAQAAPAGGKPAPKVRYDPATVVTVTGTVIGEVRVETSRGTPNVRLALKTADGTVSVHLGPASWIDRQPLRLARGDEVSVTGSRFTFEDKVGLIARSVTRGSDRLALRDATGRPAWAKPPPR